MSLWEKTVINVNKGYEKLTVFAATFSERVRAEINVIRLRMQIDDVRDAIREEQEIIGAKLLSLRKEEQLPETFDQFFALDEIAASLGKLAKLGRTMDNLLDDLGSEADALRPSSRKKTTETSA